MKTFANVFPWLVVGGVALCFAVRLVPPQAADNQMNIHAFGALTGQENGRLKPLDTFARTRLNQFYLRENMVVEDKRNADTFITVSADRWLLSLMATGLMQRYNMVSITDPKLLEDLRLRPRPSHMYSIYEFQKRWDWIRDRLIELRRNQEEKGTRYEVELKAVLRRIQVCETIQDGLDKQLLDPYAAPLFRIENDDLLAMLGLKPRPGLRYSFDEIRNRDHPEFFVQFAQKAEQLGAAQERREKIDDIVDIKVLDLATRLKVFRELTDLHGGPGIIPVAQGGAWLTLGEALDQFEQSGQEIPEARALTAILYAFATEDAKTFNDEVASYRDQVARQYQAATSKSRLEMFFNDFDPFTLCMWAYIGVFLLSCLSWLGWERPLWRAAFGLSCLTVVVHTWALLTRMYIMGRAAPVTNLYSSAVFIGWGCVMLCLVLEWIFHNGFGNLVAAVLGSLTLFVARTLDGGDTFEVLEPVLNTTFWLATHVTIVTSGYTATFVAGFIGVAFILRGLLTPKLDRTEMKTMTNMIYGVVCFATLLSFVGTVLGGIWADQSWGRFWGWDPKENGALLIVIWNALILHARWGGMIKERGMAVLAVVGNIITGWSWFGTNQLGVGLHSYGFSAAMALGLVIFWGLHVLIIGAGCLPLRFWQSFNSGPPLRANIPPVDPRRLAKINKPGRPPAGVGSAHRGTE
jgi:ABC-type transport system involved in cytochrome c biogenesis permease subunit